MAMGDLARVDEYDPFDAEKFANPAVAGAIGSLATLPRRAIQNSQFAVDTGVYDPAVPVEAAMTVMGGGVGGTGERAGVAIGSGPIRKAPMDAEAILRGHPDGIISEAGNGVVISKRGDALHAEVDGKKVGSLNMSWRGPYATSVEVAPNMQRQGIATQLYQGAEGILGRPMVPSPLGLSDSASALWKRRLSEMEPQQKQDLLREAVQIGHEAGVPKSAADRMRKLGWDEDTGGGFSLGSGATDQKGAAAIQGIRAYHSSPHDFDRFDLSKIGTGEGAQVYGHGLYFAENPAVSGQGGQYWNQFLKRVPDAEAGAANLLKQFNFNREKALEAAQSNLNAAQIWKGASGKNPRLDAYQAQIDLLASGKPVGPRTYEVNINADPAHMLDWDKPLKGHPLQADLERAGVRAHVASTRPGEPSFLPATGRDAYQSLVKDIGYGNVSAPSGYGNNPAGGASHIFREAGIPGIKYLDGGSRNAPISSMGIKQLEGRLEQYKADLAGGFGDPERMKYNIASIERELASYKPSHNYVIFDPSIVNIMKKYGIAGAAPAGMGALAAQDYYQPEERN
jgi:GNAT superfamily N-acetyltransferase